MRPIHTLAVLLLFFWLPLAAMAADSDGDGVDDAADNCLSVANSNQLDADSDGYGNACDGDYNNDGSTDDADLNILKASMGGRLDNPNPEVPYRPAVDHDADGVIGGTDFLAFKRMAGKAPGPSGLACAGQAGCSAP